MGVATERVIELVDPVVSAAGLDLEGVEVQAIGRRRLLRVLVDRDGGISLDDVAELSRTLSQTLDADEAMGDQPYVLEVSSPGVERPLELPRHWRRQRGHLVVVTRTDATTLTGRVVDADDVAATLTTDSGDVNVPYTDVSRALVQVEFRRPEPTQE